MAYEPVATLDTAALEDHETRLVGLIKNLMRAVEPSVFSRRSVKAKEARAVLEGRISLNTRLLTPSKRHRLTTLIRPHETALVAAVNTQRRRNGLADVHSTEVYDAIYVAQQNTRDSDTYALAATRLLCTAPPEILGTANPDKAYRRLRESRGLRAGIPERLFDPAELPSSMECVELARRVIQQTGGKGVVAHVVDLLFTAYQAAPARDKQAFEAFFTGENGLCTGGRHGIGGGLLKSGSLSESIKAQLYLIIEAENARREIAGLKKRIDLQHINNAFTTAWNQVKSISKPKASGAALAFGVVIVSAEEKPALPARITEDVYTKMPVEKPAIRAKGASAHAEFLPTEIVNAAQSVLEEDLPEVNFHLAYTKPTLLSPKPTPLSRDFLELDAALHPDETKSWDVVFQSECTVAELKQAAKERAEKVRQHSTSFLAASSPPPYQPPTIHQLQLPSCK